jgi:hypothetical protein
MQDLASGTARPGASHAAVDGKHRGNRPGITGNILPTFTRLTFRRLLIAAAVSFLTALSGSASHAQSGPFAGMTGNWHGGGTVTLDDGSIERIRCRATYEVAGARMGMALTCASDAYRFNLEGRVVSEGGAISGSWSESTRNVNGTLQGRGGSGSFQVVASAPGFNAQLTLTTRGSRQSVVIRADNQFRGASITLTR